MLHLPRARLGAALATALALILALASATAAGGAAVAEETPQRVVLIGNDYGVQNGPTAPSIFTTTVPWHVTEVWTYHWNGGKGAPAGTVGLKDMKTGTVLGRWKATLVNGVYWKATVSLQLPPGRYRFLDSAPSTWAQNAESGGRGMAWLMAIPGAAGPPSVQALTVRVTPASTAALPFTVTDASGKAKVYAALYENGQEIGKPVVVERSAKGQRQTVELVVPADVTGPLQFCISASNAAGESSARAPRSSCQWVSVLIPIERVSNGCGGDGWGAAAEKAQNYLGNTSVYLDSNINPSAKAYTVSFVEACNLHDAGYAGVTVRDVLHGGRIVDLRRQTRAQVDVTFLRNMRLLCERQIPASATTALENCKSSGGNASFGSTSRYDFVRFYGGAFFDADLTKAGVQREGHRTNE